MDLTCVKCNARMEEGFVVDYYFMARGPGPATWVQGTPVRSFFGYLSLAGRRKIPLRTFRCTSCGYTEAYAK
jgi:hypothetical protein